MLDPTVREIIWGLVALLGGLMGLVFLIYGNINSKRYVK